MGIQMSQIITQKREFEMSDFITRLKELGVQADDCLTLSYSEGCDVWHINESHVEESVAETSTATMLGALLASPVPVYGGWGGVEPGSDILNEMRDNGELEEYDYEGWFEEYVTDRLVATIYDGEYSLEYSTEQYDYKRGRCDISTEVRVRAGDLYNATEMAQKTDNLRFFGFTADKFVKGFTVSVETKNGTLTLN